MGGGRAWQQEGTWQQEGRGEVLHEGMERDERGSGALEEELCQELADNVNMYQLAAAHG